MSEQKEITLPDGSKYVGQVQNGEPHGQGVRIYPDGKKYEGEWKDGKGTAVGSSRHGAESHTDSNLERRLARF